MLTVLSLCVCMCVRWGEGRVEGGFAVNHSLDVRYAKRSSSPLTHIRQCVSCHTHMHARARTTNNDDNDSDQHAHTFQSGGSWAPNPSAGNILSLRRKPWQQIGSFVKPFFFLSEFNMLDFQQRRKSCYLFCKETHSRTFKGESCWKKIGLYCRMPRQ